MRLLFIQYYVGTNWFSIRIQGIQVNNVLTTTCFHEIFYIFFQVTILLELRYRSPLEGNEDSDDGLDDEDDEEFIPNVGLVSSFFFLWQYFKNEKKNPINFRCLRSPMNLENDVGKKLLNCLILIWLLVIWRGKQA